MGSAESAEDQSLKIADRHPGQNAPGALKLLKRLIVRFAGPNAQYAFQIGDENLAVADLAGLCGSDDGFDDLIDERVFHGNFDAGLGYEINDIFGTTVQLGVTTLTTEAFDFRHGHTRDTNFRECGAHVVEFEGFDDRADEFHFPRGSCLEVCGMTVSLFVRRCIQWVKARIPQRCSEALQCTFYAVHLSPAPARARCIRNLTVAPV